MHLSPTQLAALRAAAAHPDLQLRRCRGGNYSNHMNPPNRHSARAVCALHRMGLLAESEPGFQARYTLTEAGKAALAAQKQKQHDTTQAVAA